MKSIKINSSVGEDGILRLSLPVEFTNTNLEVMIILQPIENNLKKNNYEEVKIDRELCLNTLQNESTVYSLCLISDNQIACGCENGSIEIWDINALEKVKSFKAHDDLIKYLFLVDKTKLISYSHDNKIKIWDSKSLEKLREIDSSSIDYLEPTSDGFLILVSNSV